MGFNYGVLGAGRQGTAAAYDLAVHGKAETVILADNDEEKAENAAAYVNNLLNREICQFRKVDAAEEPESEDFFDGLDGFISCVPYYFNYILTKSAIKKSVCMTDLGGNTDLVRKQLLLSDKATLKDITVIPDCGMDPGFNISLISYVFELLDEVDEVKAYGAGLPKFVRPPFNYKTNFNINGLTNEYFGSAYFIRNGKVTEVPALEEIEEMIFPEPVGKLEAAVTTGGLSLLPWTLEGKVNTLENKTLRYPGHWTTFRAYRDLGLFELTPLSFKGRTLVPREFYHLLLEPKIVSQDKNDVCILRVNAKGKKNNETKNVVLEVFDTFNQDTGFTAMQRLTGFHASIMLINAVKGNTPKGVISVDQALKGSIVTDEFKKRGITVKQEIS